MRYHLFKSSRSRSLLIADSQGKELDMTNFKVLSLPGACVRHVYNFIAIKDSYDTVVFSTGGLRCNKVASTKSAEA